MTSAWLRPCPLCGSSDVRERGVSLGRGARDGALVWCARCGCRVARQGTGTTRPERQEDGLRRAADAWNTRDGVGPGASLPRGGGLAPVTTEELREILRRDREESDG